MSLCHSCVPLCTVYVLGINKPKQKKTMAKTLVLHRAVHFFPVTKPPPPPRSHTGERPFKCVQCSRGFASSGVLKAHIRTHSGLKAYKCLMCDTTFTTSGSLRRHMTTHSDLRPYMCPYCQKTFKSSPNCRKHMKTHRFVLCRSELKKDCSGLASNV